MGEFIGNGHNPHRTSSDDTVEGDHEHDNEQLQPGDSRVSGQQKQEQQSPPKPVGFFDPRLHKTRIDVAKKWIFTSKSSSRDKIANLTCGSDPSDGLHFSCTLPVLGGPVPGRGIYVCPYNNSG